MLIAAGFSLADDASSDDEPSSAEQITAGHELFVREWKVEDRRSVSGDGLGPVYNAASCVKCHRLGGMGGAGANEHNVDLLTLNVPRNVAVTGGDLRQRVAAFHPALAISQLSATTVLHRFSPDPNYDAWRGRFLSASRQAQLPLARIVAFTTGANKHPLKGMNPVQRLDGMAYQHSQRNTPALFGAGMIDSLPDSVFVELQKRQSSKTGGVSGRAPRAANGKVGRFGWRGQTENLHEFVLGACAVELGLEAPGRPQPIDPLQVGFDRPLLLGRHGLDISDEQCKSLTHFVAHLPAPRQLTPTDDLEAQTVARGERRFEKIGCADCHVRQVAHVTGIYSDLLLHDLGEGLEDPVPASPAQGSTGSASYYGGADSLLVKASPEERREWRTPPLWGVSDSAPYLHDGRARTFAEAIAWHGGEAAKSAQDFRRLEVDEQEEVLAFLKCLAAPTPESLALEKIAFVGDQ
ncbi:MAG TPA: di-heme oxidoredictase family protein [Pirellulales bacterium]|nr:di-heme oxidoredictase family protein [Pirellulales bacterium]